MWKVLIVEDEVFVRESVRKIIQWEELGFEIIGEAGNGLEALELIREHQPDLVISDIIMPEMDGVELLKKTREEGFDCRFVMLSCMNDFEYVRQAMEYGASNYILKLSMNIQSLKDALVKINLELLRRSQPSAPNPHEFYQQVWQCIWETPTEEPDYESSDLPVLNNRRFKVTIFSVLHGAETFTKDDFLRLNIAEWDRSSLLHSFSMYGQTTFFCWSSSPLLFHSEHMGTCPFGIVYSSAIAGRELLPAWSNVLKKLDVLWYVGETGMQNSENIGLKLLPPLFTWKQERQLMQQFEQRKAESCIKLIGDIWDAMMEHQLPMISVKETAERIGKMFCFTMDIPYTWSHAVSNAIRHHQLKEVMLQKVDEFRGGWVKQTEELTDHHEINKIITFISQNYGQDLTVKYLAHYVSMDENYVSSLFKKKTGNSLIHYLHRVRIEKAIYYLEHTDLTIAEIGDRVGFANENYFFRIFKRSTQYTPTQYRKILQANN